MEKKCEETSKKISGKGARRSKPIKNKLKRCKVMYLNIRGLKSKMAAVEELVKTEEPTILCLVEMLLKEEDKIELQGYITAFRNERETKDGGGIAVREELENVTTEIKQEKEHGESIWISIDYRHKCRGTAIRLGVIYAQQESRTNITEYKHMYKKIGDQVEAGRKDGQKVLIVGDFNCKIGSVSSLVESSRVRLQGGQLGTNWGYVGFILRPEWMW